MLLMALGDMLLNGTPTDMKHEGWLVDTRTATRPKAPCSIRMN